ncbi:MAG: LrgB family protein, partial [Caldilinea sp.]|nr:LrgB family protein [Caldilinea sp.]
MIATSREIWVYLAASPLLHLTMTLAAYLAGDWLFRKSGQKAIFNPVLIAIVILVSILLATGTSYATYFEGAQ